MTERRPVVRVRIGGEEYALRSDRPEAHTRAVAEQVDRALRDVLASGTIIETHKAAVLAALALADELVQLRDGRSVMSRRIAALTDEMKRLLPPAKRPSRTSGTFAVGEDAG